MSVITEFTTKVSSAFKEQKESMASFLIVVITLTLNKVSSDKFFKCPAHSHTQYGLCFLIGPAVVLALLTILVSFGTIKSLAGICRKDEDVPVDALFGRRRRTWVFILRKTSLALGYSFVAYLTWVVLTLLTTDTYSCIKIGPMPKEKAKMASYLVDKEKNTTQSRIVGIALFVTCLTLATVMHFIVKCCFTDPPKKMLASMRTYDELEAFAANKVFTSLMEAMARCMVSRLHMKHLMQRNAC